MKIGLLNVLVLMIMLFSMFSFLVFAEKDEVTTFAVSLPDKVPNIIAQTAQKDKAAIVYIQSIVSGTAVFPTYSIVPDGGATTTGAGGNIVGTWQHPQETLTFYANGEFTGNSVQTKAFSGTYTTQRNVLTINYVSPSISTAQFTYSVSGNTLQLSHPQIGTYTYTRVGTTIQTGSADVVANVQNWAIVKDEGPGARIETEKISAEFSGTGFIVSSDGYIITNAHVVLAGKEPKSLLFNQLARSLEAKLYAEVSKHYNIPQEDKEKVVQIIANKLINYFIQYGQIEDVNKDFYIFNGVASPGEDLKVKSWPAVVKKQGTMIEKVGGIETWGRDVAILKVEKTNLPTVTLGDSSKVQVGDSIFVIGYPGTKAEEFFKPQSVLEATVTQGVVSAKKTLNTGVEAIQTDASINPGNSGGPAYNEKGEVIGIATFGAGPETGIEAIKFAMPINLAKEFMNELNIENKHSILDTKYAEALNAFLKRDCYTAKAKMKDVLTLYPGHPYAQDYITECERAIITGEVSKPLNTTLIITIVGIIFVGGGIFFFFKKRKITSKK